MVQLCPFFYLAILKKIEKNLKKNLKKIWKKFEKKIWKKFENKIWKKIEENQIFFENKLKKNWKNQI